MQARRALAGTAVTGALLLALAGCGASGSTTSTGPGGSGAGQGGASAAAPSSATPPRASAPPAAAAQMTMPGTATQAPERRFAFRVAADGTISPGFQHVTVPAGTRISVTVTSALADELHAHPLDAHADLPAGTPTTLSFVVPDRRPVHVELHENEIALLVVDVATGATGA